MPATSSLRETKTITRQGAYRTPSTRCRIKHSRAERLALDQLIREQRRDDLGDIEHSDYEPLDDHHSTASPAGLMDALSTHELITTLLLSLPAREERLLRLLYGIGQCETHTQVEVGALFQITSSKVFQLERKAMHRLIRTAHVRHLMSGSQWAVASALIAAHDEKISAYNRAAAPRRKAREREQRHARELAWAQQRRDYETTRNIACDPIRASVWVTPTIKVNVMHKRHRSTFLKRLGKFDVREKIAYAIFRASMFTAAFFTGFDIATLQMMPH